MTEKIVFSAHVVKVQTMQHGGFRIYIDTSNKVAAAHLLAYSDETGIIFDCEFSPNSTKDDADFLLEN